MAMSGFLMAVSCWRHRLQCIVVMQSFLRLLKLHKLVVGKRYLSRGGLTQCHGVSDHGLNLHQNIPDRVSPAAVVNAHTETHCNSCGKLLGQFSVDCPTLLPHLSK